MFFNFKKPLEVIVNPVDGEIIDLEKVYDPMFSQKMLGDGFAVIPNSNYIFAPVSGKVITLFPTAHAIGIESEKGVEVLIHVGLNTVELKGEHFVKKINQGDNVKKGDLLLTFDNNLIRSKGYDTTTMVIITNLSNFKSIELLNSGYHESNTPILNVMK